MARYGGPTTKPSTKAPTGQGEGSSTSSGRMTEGDTEGRKKGRRWGRERTGMMKGAEAIVWCPSSGGSSGEEGPASEGPE